MPAQEPSIPRSIDQADRALTEARLRDQFGHQLHTALAMAYLFALPIKSAPGDITFGLLLGWTCCRIFHTWRSYRFVLRSPAVLSWLAWMAWMAASLMWSPDVGDGWDEVNTCRVLLLPFMLWPVLDRLPWLIASAIAGVLLQNGVQIMQALGWISPRTTDPADRFAGFTHAIKTATWCTAAMAWSMSAVLRAGGRRMWIWVGVFIAATVGLVLSGSRGPWIAEAVTLPLMLVVLMVRRPVLRWKACVMPVGCVIALGAAWPIVKPVVKPRIEQAQTEYRKARDEHIYWTSVGMRVGFWRWSIGMFDEHPIIGFGAGGYQTGKERQEDFIQALERAKNPSQDRWLAKNHPHSITLYALTCTGIVGTLILLTAILTTAWQCWRDRQDHIFADGTLFALIAWLIGAQFDTYTHTGQLFGMVGLFVAFTLRHRPSIRLIVAANDEAPG